MGKKGGGGDGGASQARADEQERQAKIRGGTNEINGIFDSQFNDGFFEKQKQGYLEYATPQLNKQYGDAQKELTFALARSGNLDSSTRAAKEGDLSSMFATQDRAVKDQALSMSNDTRNSVESARSDLIRTLSATGDATGAANSALTRAGALSQPTAYSPLGQLFSNFTAGLGTQAALERANAMSGGAIKPRYDTGLFGNSGAVKVS